MPHPTPFHTRTSAVCDSHEWRNWSGFLSAGVYEPSHEREYYAIRNSAGLIDVSPLYKYEVTGPGAARLVDRVITRDVTKQKIGQVYYTPWCDARGKVIDDGTVSRLAADHFRITSADPNGRWFQDVGYGLNATVTNVTDDLAALALQGPRSRVILEEVVEGIDFGKLPYFHLAHGTVDGFPVTVTRTGYTGDLGYELWVRPEHAERLWDGLIDRGNGHGILPAGIVALDVARVEAGLVMIAVDYVSSHHALIESQKSSPYEIGLGWAVRLDKGDFIGKRALVAEQERGSAWTFVGVQCFWPALERLFAEEGLPLRRGLLGLQLEDLGLDVDDQAGDHALQHLDGVHVVEEGADLAGDQADDLALGALGEAGDVVAPLAEGALRVEEAGEALAELAPEA